MERPPMRKPFPSAVQDAAAAKLCPETPQTRSDSYRLAYADLEFMLRDELRPVRLQLELLKPELVQQEHGIEATVVVFGSARLPDPETARQQLEAAEVAARQQPSDPRAARQLTLARTAVANARYYEEARKLARLISQTCHDADGCKLVVITGGGPGIMEAANRGAHDVGAKSVLGEPTMVVDSHMHCADPVEFEVRLVRRPERRRLQRLGSSHRTR